MQRLFQQIDARLRRFIRQREALLLLTTCKDEETAFLLKTIQSIDESSADIFWMFAEDFVDAQSYLDAIVSTFRTRVSMLNGKLVEAGKEPWPALPPRMVDSRQNPFARMQTLLLYARKRIPNLETARLVVTLSPFKIQQPVRWRIFLRDFVEYEQASPWCHHMRIIAREREALFSDLTGDLRERTNLKNFRSTQTYSINLSTDALRAAVKEDIADPALPIADRAQALLTDAMVDYAHQRYKPALAKYQLLRDFYGYLGLEPMLALVLNGIGEVFARTGLREQAVAHFEMAMTPAINSNSHPVLLNVSLNLANLYLVAEQWEKATQHYIAAEALATAMLNANVKLACLENIGLCRMRLQDWRGAQKPWQDGAALARSLKENDACRRLFGRLRTLYVEANMRDHVRAIDDELRELA